MSVRCARLIAFLVSFGFLSFWLSDPISLAPVLEFQIQAPFDPAVEKSPVPSLFVLLRDRKISRIRADIDYVSKQVGLGRFASEPRRLMARRDFFRRLLSDARFRDGSGHLQKKRVSDVLSALTILGEARRWYMDSRRQRVEFEKRDDGDLVPLHDQAIVHHALIYQTLVNRARIGRRYLLQADYDQIFNGQIDGTPGQAAVARNQYSCWMSEYETLAHMLTAERTLVEEDALEMAAATIVGIEDGSIRLSENLADFVTSYYSPVSAGKRPAWAFGSKGVQREPVRNVFVEVEGHRMVPNRRLFQPFFIWRDTLVPAAPALEI